MKTTITPAVTKTVEQVISPKTITVELTVEDAAVIAAIIGRTKSGVKYTNDNTCVYALFDQLADFINDENGKTWNQHIREYVSSDAPLLALN
jgi:hypothetical protein